MSVTRRFVPFAVALAVAVVFAPPGWAADAPSCADCHDAKAFTSAHTRVLGADGERLSGNALCERCHGDGRKHIAGDGDKAQILVPRGHQGVATCLTCHDQPSQDRSFRSGVHASALPSNCLSCHSVHGHKAPHLLARPANDLCASCHGTQATSLTAKPYGHKLRHGGLGCVSCHDPHARAGQSALKRSRADELPCLGCHREKRGPYVFEHVGGTAGTCLSCHEPHGSSNPRQLKRARVDQLCLECHSRLSSTALGSQPPAIHNLSLPRWQSCTTCHVAIHGSNRSPQLLK